MANVYLRKLSLVSKFQEGIKKHSPTSQEYGNFVHQKVGRAIWFVLLQVDMN
jgi:hypothetical protein